MTQIYAYVIYPNVQSKLRILAFDKAKDNTIFFENTMSPNGKHYHPEPWKLFRFLQNQNITGCGCVQGLVVVCGVLRVFGSVFILCLCLSCFYHVLLCWSIVFIMLNNHISSELLSRWKLSWEVKVEWCC